jgi:hypothetical protein
MKTGTYPQILTKSTESLESTLKTIFNKLENLNKVDKILDAYNQPKLNQEGIKHLNNPIICNEIEIAIKNLPTKKNPRPDEFIAEFYQTIRELTPIVLKLSRQ